MSRIRYYEYVEYFYIYRSFHDKKRRIEYHRIARKIEDENRLNPDKPPKGIVGDHPNHLYPNEENTIAINNKVYGNLLQEITQKSSIRYS